MAADVLAVITVAKLREIYPAGAQLTIQGYAYGIEGVKSGQFYVLVTPDGAKHAVAIHDLNRLLVL